jgi:mono/diheme cytochrome c family protein
MSRKDVIRTDLARLVLLALVAELGPGASFMKPGLLAQTPGASAGQGLTSKPGPELSDSDARPSQPARASAPAKPTQVFRTACMKCHDADGRGEGSRETWPNIPNFTDAKWHRSRSDADLSRSIVEGKGKSMPPMKKKLGSCSVQEMVSFIREFRDGKQVVPEHTELPREEAHPATAARSSANPDPTDPRHVRQVSLTDQNGARLFQRFCVKCHGADGTAMEMRASLPTIPNFTNPAWHAQRPDPQLVASILTGKGTAMPAFAGRVSENDVRDLAAFVRALNPRRSQQATSSPTDFESRFRQLEQEYRDLDRQIRKLSGNNGS